MQWERQNHSYEMILFLNMDKDGLPALVLLLVKVNVKFYRYRF